MKFSGPFVLLLVLGFLTNDLEADNLLKNSGFESLRKCPAHPGDWAKVSDWIASDNIQILAYCMESFPRQAFLQKHNPAYQHEILPHSGFSFVRVNGKGAIYQEINPSLSGLPLTLQVHLAQQEWAKSGFQGLSLWGKKENEWVPLPLDLRFSPPEKNDLWARITAEWSAFPDIEALKIEFSSPDVIYVDDIWLEPSAEVIPYGNRDRDFLFPRDFVNTLQNSDFESKVFCPEQREDLTAARHWLTGRNTPDYFHRCAAGTPAGIRSELGIQAPHSGNAYAGFWAITGKLEGKEEYLKISFPKELNFKERYLLRMYVSLAEVSQVALDGIQVQIHRSARKPTRVFTLRPADNKWLDDQDRWMKLEVEFEGMGDEYCLFIGNFNDRKAVKSRKISNPTRKDLPTVFRKSAYYFIDDVVLISKKPDPAETPVVSREEPSPEEPDEDPVPEFQGKKVQEGEEVRLDAVYFDFSAATLRPESETQLADLVQFLREYPQLRLSIEGHTDRTGSPEFNQTLSENRAAAVRQYLIDQGIDPDRLESIGFGEDRPINIHRTADARQQNRRVVFRIIPF